MVCSENCLFIATGSTARGRNSRKVKYPIKIKAMLKRRTIKLPRYLKTFSLIPMFLSHYVKPKVAIIFVATSSGVMFELFIFVIFTFGNVLSSSPSWLTSRCSLKVLSNSFREKSTSRFEGFASSRSG